MKGFKLLVKFTLLSILLLLISFCQKKAEPDKNTIKIGTLFILSGVSAHYGIDAQRAINLAIEEINTRGGIKGKKLKVIYEDTKGLPQIAAIGMQKLASQDKVPVVIGAIYSSCTLAAVPVAERLKVVLLSPGSSNPNITKAGDYIFRNWISDDLEGNMMAEFVVNELRMKSTAILYINNDYGKGLEEVFMSRYKELGGTIVATESYEQGGSDFRTQLLKIKTANSEAIYVPGYYQEIANILKQAKELKINSQFLSAVAFEDPNLIKLAGYSAENVIYSTPAFNPESDDEVVKRFVIAFKKKYYRTPGIFAAHAYDAVKIIAKVMSENGFKAEQIKRGLYSIKNYPGVSGRTTFDANGDVIKPVMMKTVKNGAFVPYFQKK